MPQKDPQFRLGDDGELIPIENEEIQPEKPKRGLPVPDDVWDLAELPNVEEPDEKSKRGISTFSLRGWLSKSFVTLLGVIVLGGVFLIGWKIADGLRNFSVPPVIEYPNMSNTWISDQGCNLPSQTMIDVNTTLSALQHEGIASVYEVCKTGISNGTQWIQDWNNSLKQSGKTPTALFLIRPDASGADKVDTFFANQSLPVSQDLFKALSTANNYTYFSDVNGGLYQLTNLVNDTFRKYANRQ